MSYIEKGFSFPPKEPEKAKERISDEELGNLLAAVGNSEAKALTLLAMQQGIIYTERDLYRRVLEIQGVRKGWRMDMRVPFRYCQKSLSPIGLVTYEVIDPDMNTYGYMLTDYGEIQGKIFAALVLDFSQRHPQTSLYDLFSDTKSRSKPKEKITENQSVEFKKRAPLTRLQLFRELLSTISLPIRQADLSEKMGEDRTIISDHLKSLSEKHIITYNSTEADQPLSFYKLSPFHPDSPPLPKNRRRSLTSKVYQILSEDLTKEWTRGEIAERIMQDHPEKEKSKNSILTHVPSVLSYLRSLGYAEIRKFSNRIRSVITISGSQRTVLSDLLNIIEQFKNQDPEILERGKSLGSSFLAQPEKISTLFQKAKEHSPYANQKPSEEFEVSILDIITSSIYPFNSSEIRSSLEQEYGRKLSPQRVHSLLNSLKLQGKVIGEKEKHSIKWRIPFETPHSPGKTD